MARVVTGLFSTSADAESALRDLTDHGIPQASVSILTKASIQNATGEKHKEVHKTVRAAEEGAAIGGGVGLLGGLVALTIPGVGPLLALGPLATVLATIGVGAAAGGLFGGLIAMGVPREQAAGLERAIRQGRTAIVAHVDDDDVDPVAESLGAHNAYEVSIAAEQTGPAAEQPSGHDEPARDFGARYGSSEDYRTRDWTEIEPDLRREWEASKQGSWDEFRDSVRTGWDHARNTRG